jgi:hypothetical protein
MNVLERNPYVPCTEGVVVACARDLQEAPDTLYVDSRNDLEYAYVSTVRSSAVSRSQGNILLHDRCKRR